MTIADLFHTFHTDVTALLARLQPYLVGESSGLIPQAEGHGFEEPAEARVEEHVSDPANPYDFPMCLIAWQEGDAVRAILHTFDLVAGAEIISSYIIPQEAIFLPFHSRRMSDA